MLTKNPMTFAKLFSSITESTVWREDDHTRILWITMLAMANKNGYVFASVPGLADRARIPLKSCISGLDKFHQPDEWSRTKEFEGRRIRTVDGGWQLLNYQKHRAIRDEEERREYMRDLMRARRAKPVSDVSSVSHGEPGLSHTEADTEADTDSEERESKDIAVLFSEEVEPRDPIPNVFEYFLKQSGKNGNYTLTEKRRKMAALRWREQERIEFASKVPREKVRKVISDHFRHIIDELVACSKANSFWKEYVEWEQLFRSREQFEKWLDRYENDFAAEQAKKQYQGNK